MVVIILSPNEVLLKGLHFIAGVNKDDISKQSFSTNTLIFHKHYGSSPLDLADQWYDLMTTDLRVEVINENEKSWNGFRMFLVAHSFLWAYDKNSFLLASRFGISESRCRGEPLWKWIRRIAALREKKIVWDENLESEDTAVMGITIDGVDVKTYEKSSDRLNVDPKNYSKKFAHGGLKYEIAIAVHSSKCVHLAGPYRGGMHDLTMFRIGGLKQKLERTNHLKAIVDRGYRSTKRNERDMMCYPDLVDSKELHNYKTRARLRHESFNGRIKYFNSLVATYRGGINKHRYVMEAVCVTVQYQMENGSPLFAV